MSFTSIDDSKERPGRRRLVGLIVAIAGLALFWKGCMPKMGEGVTKEGLLALRPGMTEAQVVQLIGKPLSRRKSYGPHLIGEEPVWEGDWSWSYGEQLLFDFGPGFEVSVNFHEGRMAHAAVERFDLGIWWCNRRECPVVWNKDEFERLPGP